MPKVASYSIVLDDKDWVGQVASKHMNSRWCLKPIELGEELGQKKQRPRNEVHRRKESSDTDDDEEREVTGKVLWDCAQVLWDLLANPHPQNAFSVRGKVGTSE